MSETPIYMNIIDLLEGEGFHEEAEKFKDFVKQVSKPHFTSAQIQAGVAFPAGVTASLQYILGFQAGQEFDRNHFRGILQIKKLNPKLKKLLDESVPL